MSVDSIEVAGQTTVSASATAATPAKAAEAVQDVMSGGIVRLTDAALQANPKALLWGVGAILAFLAACFALILVCALAANRVAETYVTAIFSNGYVWLIVAGVVLGSAWLLPKPSPVQKP